MPSEMRDAKSIFLEALEEHPPEAWPAFLDRACAGQPELRRRVDELLQAHREAGTMAAGNLPESEQLGVERPGGMIGRYKLLQQIGEGGMGTVWMAEQTAPVQRKVALKIIKVGMDSRQVLARFEAERQALALMDHPNIAKVLDAGAIGTARGQGPGSRGQESGVRGQESGVGGERSRGDDAESATDDPCALTPDSCPPTPDSHVPGRPYFVMELVKGQPITKYCDEHRLSPRQRLELFTSVCQAIQHAHQKGIIHRDIKPSNVLVAPYDGRPVVKVIDFGVAKATGQRLTEKTLFTEFGAVVGTVEYMSPEQAELNNQDIDTRSDIYSLGVLLYELLTGTTPLTRDRLKKAAFTEMLRMIREEEPPKPSTRLSESKDALPSISAQRQTEPAKLTKLVRGELDWIVMKALEKERGRRYETANGFAMDVMRYLADEPVQACPPSVGYRLRKLMRRYRWTLAATAAVFLALVAGVVGTTLGLLRAREAQALAETETAAKTEALHESQASAQLARRTIHELMTNVSESTLLDEPALQPLRMKLLEQALEYYREFVKLRADDPTIQAEFAVAHLRLSGIYHSMDRNDDALVALARGLDAVEHLRKDYPGVQASQRPLAGFWAGRRRGSPATQAPSDPENALRTLTRATVLWEQLASEHADLPAFRSDLAAMHGLVGDLLNNDPERHVESLARLEKARQILDALSKQEPEQAEHLSALARVHRGLAAAHENAGRIAEAQEAFGQLLGLREQLAAAQPKVPAYRAQLAEAYLSWAVRHRDNNRPAQREAYRRKAIEVYEKLVADFAGVAEYQTRLRTVRGWLIGDLKKEGRHEDAALLLKDAVKFHERLAAARPHDAVIQLGLIQTYVQAGKWEGRIKGVDPKHAEESLRKAIATYHRLVDDYPKISQYRQDLGRCHWYLADLLTANERYEAAEPVIRDSLTVFERAAAEFPNQPIHRQEQGFCLRMLAHVMEKTQRIGEAQTAYGRARAVYGTLVKDYPENAFYRQEIGYTHWLEAFLLERMSRYADAETALNHALQVHKQGLVDFPNHEVLKERLAENYLHLVRIRRRLKATGMEVKDLCREALKVKPDHVEAARTLVEVLERQGRWQEAIAVLGAFSEAAPNQVYAHQELARILTTCPVLDYRDPPRALAAATKATELAPRSSWAWQMLGWARYRAGNWQDSIDALHKSMDLQDNPKGGDSWQWYFLAMAHFQKGEKAQAQQWFNRAHRWTDTHGLNNPQELSFRAEAMRLGLAPTIENPLEAARAAAAAKDWEKAALAYAEALRHLPVQLTWSAPRAKVCRELAEWDAVYRRVAELRPDDADVRIGRGRHFVALRQWKEAAAAYQEVIDRMPLGDAGAEYASLLLLVDDQAGYKRFCEALVKRLDASKDPFGFFVVARACAVASQPVVAPAKLVAWAEKTVRSDGPAWCLHVLSLAHLRAGQFEQALQQAMAANELPWHGTARAQNWLVMAMAQARLGRSEDARRSLDQARSILEKGGAVGPPDLVPLELLRREAEDLLATKD